MSQSTAAGTVTPFPAKRTHKTADPFAHIPEQGILDRAQQIYLNRLREPGPSVHSPKTAIEFLKLKLGSLEYEVVAILLKDVQGRLIEYVELTRGTTTRAHVEPREVLREVIRHNATSAILVHNHPSGIPEPSAADRALTAQTKALVASIDATLDDHIIIAGDQSFSFVDSGQMP